MDSTLVGVIIGAAATQVGNIVMGITAHFRERGAEGRRRIRAEDERRMRVYPELLSAGIDVVHLVHSGNRDHALDEAQHTIKVSASAAELIGDARVRTAVRAYYDAIFVRNRDIADWGKSVFAARDTLIIAMRRERGFPEG